DGNATIDVNVSDATCAQLRNDLRWIARQVFYHRARRRGSDRAAAEDEDWLVKRPRAEPEHRLVCLAAHDQRIDRRHELFVAVRFAVVGQEVERAVVARDESVDAGADENRCFHDAPLLAAGGTKTLRAMRVPLVPLGPVHLDAEARAI